MKKKIIKTDVWSSQSVRDVCIKEHFYTSGDNEDYSRMLDYVESHEPTKKAIYKVARDIYRHSSINLPVETIMYVLRQEAVKTYYSIDRGETRCSD